MSGTESILNNLIIKCTFGKVSDIINEVFRKKKILDSPFENVFNTVLSCLYENIKNVTLNVLNQSSLRNI